MKQQQLLKFIVALPVMLIGLLANAQVTTKIFRTAVPAEFIETSARKIPDIFIKAPAELEKFLTLGEDPNPNEMKFRFGVAKNESVNVLERATIIEQGGFITYLSTVTAEKALNMSLSFSKFFMPKNAVLKIYSKNELTDGITETENKISKRWRTRLYQGNRINISLKVPVAEKGKAMLEIGKIIFGFRQIGDDILEPASGTNPLPPPGKSADCHINVACNLGSNWEKERRSVALIYDDDGNLASGSLVMNTCQSNKPYVLTAYHAFSNGGPNPSNCKYVFKYWRLGCSNISEQYNETYEIDGLGGQGEQDARIEASSQPSDFALILLPRAPSASSGVTYSGWNWGGGVPSMITALHHPWGDVMKISQTTQSGNISPATWSSGFLDHWQAIFDADKGFIQRGSSGGPIYDENKRIVGQIHGTYNIPPPCVNAPQDPNPNVKHCICEPNTNEETIAKRSLSGKFSSSWTGEGIPAKRLKDWLNPLNLNTFTTETKEVYELQPDQYTAQIQGENSICSLNTTEVYSIDLPPGATISSWGQSNSSVNLTSISPNSVSVTYVNNLNSSVTITANVVLNGPCNQGTYPRPKTIALGGASCSTRTAYQMVNGNPVQVGNCIRLTELRSIYQKGKEGKYGNTEYYTTVWVTETYPNATTAWSYVSSSGSSGYPSYIVTGNSVQVIISNTLPYGWIRLRYTSTTSCGDYSQDYWFTPQPSTTSCPVFNPCLVAERTEEITNIPSEKISLSPNPTNGQFRVLLNSDAKDAEIREVRIKNKMGMEVYRQIFKNAGRERMINLPNLPMDIYIVEVFDGKKWLTEKLSLQK